MLRCITNQRGRSSCTDGDGTAHMGVSPMGIHTPHCAATCADVRHSSIANERPLKQNDQMPIIQPHKPPKPCMSMRRAFSQARLNAKYRRIAWELTFEQFESLWTPHWPRKASEHLVLARFGDKGAYAIGNVRILTRSENSREGALIIHLRHGHKIKTPKHVDIINNGAIIQP
jgi:hypothetical protein